MNNKKVNYSRLPEDDDDDGVNNAQPPPYTPSEAPSSPYITPGPAAPFGSPNVPSSSSTELYPTLQYMNPQPFVQSGISPSSGYQAPPHGHLHQYPQQLYPQQLHPQQLHPQQQQLMPPPHTIYHPPTNSQITNVVGPPMILMRPPARIEELRNNPGLVVCQHCRHLVQTETLPENGSCTYLGVLILLLAGVSSCGCCLLPLCMTSWKDIMHSCPNCQEDIGLYSRSKGRTYPVRRLD
ncbi:LITAF-like zinc ribbon domain-containing protein [Gamsiella multidivaricata]|uniref:LITAF-like zinc ribbon domain-containing protein n=1 Tax=Gamsiella multidivaricata TaxID=101098 RepID=UPI0022209487|nr:LITAF-like zinc ribbon domain-containing protein [Gamsiella multidivaricata]KAI7819615.1 LITAF-like zinc ribbon domain-containing protein [Gamsiella multidivaricata]